MSIDSDNKLKIEHTEWVRKIAREEALKCIREVLSQMPAFADVQRTDIKKHQSG